MNQRDDLRDLVPVIEFKKREKHPWTMSNTPLWVMLTFFKFYKWYQIAQSIKHEDFNI